MIAGDGVSTVPRSGAAPPVGLELDPQPTWSARDREAHRVRADGMTFIDAHRVRRIDARWVHDRCGAGHRERTGRR